MNQPPQHGFLAYLGSISVLLTAWAISLGFVGGIVFLATDNQAIGALVGYLAGGWALITLTGLVIAWRRQVDYIAALEARTAGKGTAGLTALLADIDPEDGGSFFPDATSRAWAGIARKLERRLSAQVEYERQLRSEQVDFFTLWVHQVKTPLSVLRLMGENAQETALEPGLSNELNRIEDALRKALGFSRLHDLAADFLIREQNLEELLRRALEPYRPLIEAKGLGLRFSGVWRPVPADSKWLIFVFDQLLSNAIKYSFEEGELLFFSGSPLDFSPWAPNHSPVSTQAGWLLVIEDQGCGIESHELERVWSRSFTGEQGRRDLSATGMGLWLAKRMCGAMGICLGIESRPGKGTRLILHFGA